MEETQPDARVFTPHDKFAKYTFSDVRCAEAELSFALGPETAALVDWASLKLSPTELADHLGSRYPDLRFTARLLGLPVQFDVIFEHQSTHDALMPVRCFCHTGSIWTEARRQDRTKMPLVVNVVLHNGPEPWLTPLELWRTIEGEERYQRLAPHLLPTLPVLLDDLAQTTDAQMRDRGGSPQVTLALLALKHGRPGELAAALREAADLLQETPDGALGETISYAWGVESPANRPAIGEVLKSSLGAERGEVMITIADELRQEGRQKGLQEGRQKGLQEGRQKGLQEGRQEALIRLIRARGLTLTPAQQARLAACEDAAQLEQWCDVAEQAQSVEQIFGATTH